ncbi:hypothetical protein [uncultured Streptomyces sp.]|uniref:hypothetical protein n=1 Tax=uncultured Streptomyces sp. TaxID=174707 RepID=UPI00260D11A5|nr:hypothetical protein [uncultured Streptomyces sp.]
MMRQHMKMAALLAVVVLALTGFSTSSHGGKSKSSGKSSSSSGSKSKSKSGGSSGGGGCSSSKKSNHDYDDDDDYTDTTTDTYATATPSATASDAPVVRVISCAQPRKGKRKAVTSSVVEITSTELGTQTYEIEVTFVDARGTTVDTAEVTTELDYDETDRVTVRMDSPGKVARVKRCRVTAETLV